MTAETVLEWKPPPGMATAVRDAWKAFYRRAYIEYGVTPVFYRQLYLAQSGRCYICRTAKGIHPDDPKGAGGRRLGIDHNHLLGHRIEAVRGLLCTGSLSANTCNRLIARYSPAQLERALQQLLAPPAQKLRGMVDENTPDSIVTGLLT